MFYRDIFNHLPESACICRAADGLVIYNNPKFETLFGFGQEEINESSLTLFDTTNVEHAPQLKENIANSISNEGSWSGEILSQKKDGSAFWSKITVSPFEHPEDGLVWIAMHEDISDKKQALETLEKSEKKYRDLFENSRDAILIIENETFVECNQATLDMLGYKDKGEFLQQHPSKLSPPKQPDGRSSDEKADEMMRIALEEGSNRFEWDHVRANGEVFPVEVLLTPLVTEKGVQQIHCVWRDITIQKKQRDQILYQARYDSLSGLPNRMLALDRLEQLIKESHRRDTKVAVLFLDLDNFKKVNDTLGHEWGDKILEETAKRLKNVLRDEDTVGRLGGDEFIILLGKINDPYDVNPIVHNLVESFRLPFYLDQRELILTASIGIAFYPDDAKTSSDLLRLADTAMYHTKQFGRNNFHFYTDQMNKEAERKLLLEEHLHGAVERGEFTLAFQPILKLADEKIVGAEALLRWHNPVLAQVRPDEFIAVAEQTGRIVHIGEFVVTEALKAVAKWQPKDNGVFRIAVNVSPRQFRDPNLLSCIQQNLKTTNLRSDVLKLEITEGVLLSGLATVAETLEQLNHMGIGLVMDDFGTGYSSMSYLRRYPFDTLKIDRSFINDVHTDKADRELVCAIINLAHSLGLKVVAEGVETAEQGKFLKEHGCDFVQGFYYGRPISEEEFGRLLNSFN